MSIENTCNFSRKWMLPTLFAMTLSACFHPPFNNFKKEPPNLKRTALGTGIGAGIGALLGAPGIGAAVGATAGTIVNIYRVNKKAIIDQLRRQDIQYIEYGDTMTLIVPTDHYFMFNSAQLNDICYEGLNNIVRLLRFYPRSKIYVVGFTDNIGTYDHKRRLTQAQAETMLTFLWANGIPARLLRAKGFGDKFNIGDNHLIHGSAFNRRLEIQWLNVDDKDQHIKPLEGGMK